MLVLTCPEVKNIMSSPIIVPYIDCELTLLLDIYRYLQISSAMRSPGPAEQGRGGCQIMLSSVSAGRCRDLLLSCITVFLTDHSDVLHQVCCSFPLLHDLGPVSKR